MKFNIKTNTTTVTNYEGAKAYQLSDKLELYTAVVTGSLENNFYEDGAKKLKRIISLINKNDPFFVAKLAIYAREKMNLRSIPLVLTVELAKIHKGDSLIKMLVSRVVQRADEITELLAYYTLANDRKGVKKLNQLSKQVQKGLAISFNNFDEYQFAKYNRDGAVTLKDALFLVHPKAKDDTQQMIFNKLVNNSLDIPYTWETELSALGQQSFEDEKAKKQAVTEKWEELIFSGKLGYMALMRNLRNILQANVSDKTITEVCNTLANEKKVARARQLPFRFLAAYREIVAIFNNSNEEISKNQFAKSAVLEALEKATYYSSQNIKGFENDPKVVIACDVSGSMQSPISKNSKVLAYDIGLMLGMLLKSRLKNAQIGMFGETWKRMDLPTKAVLHNVQEMYKREGEVGYSTNGHLVIDDLIKSNTIVDKVMIFTDCQIWNAGYSTVTLESAWKRYQKIAPNAKIYVFDLMGYGQSPLKIEGNVHLIAGWSDKIFEVLHNIEKGGKTLDAINKIEL